MNVSSSTDMPSAQASLKRRADDASRFQRQAKREKKEHLKKKDTFRPETVKPFYNALTEAWSGKIPSCENKICRTNAEGLRLKVWCHVEVTTLPETQSLEEPLHRTISAACDLKTNAEQRQDEWQKNQDKKVQRANTGCIRKIADAEAVRYKVR